MTKQPEFAWLVQNRSKIQSLLLELRAISPAEEEPDSQRTALFQLLTGAGFSLWRAVFLADSDRTAPAVTSDAKTFLRVLIKDNAINYSQEDATRSWTVGYYVNNACFRLQMAYRKTQKKSALRDRLDAFLEPQSVPGPVAANTDPHEAWELAFAAAKEIIALLAGGA